MTYNFSRIHVTISLFGNAKTDLCKTKIILCLPSYYTTNSFIIVLYDFTFMY